MTDTYTELSQQIADLTAALNERKEQPNFGAMPVEYFTAPEAAAFLRTTEKALEHWRARGQGPRWIKIGRSRVRYALADLRRFMEDRGGGRADMTASVKEI